jgi:predicted dinucleotide-binding enzyme
VKVSIIGTGLLRAGHDIMWSSRTPDAAKARGVVDRADGGTVATVAETLAFSDVIVLAVGGDQTLDVAARLDDWNGKVVIDATNILGPTDGSPTEAFAAAAAGAQVARAFNTIGAEHYLDPVFSGSPASMFLCGSTEQARNTAGSLARDLGFEPVDIGDLTRCGILDDIARLWVGLVMAGRDRNFAISVVEK